MAMPLIPREVHVAVTEGSATETVADVITFPMTLLWVIGVAVLLTREIVGHVRLAGARENAPAELRRLLEWPDRIPLAVSDRAPLTIGLLRPRVVLPRDIAVAFPLAVARHIARHEVSHRRWRDPLVYALMRIAASLFWLWPLWPLLRWARREREVAADEFALRSARGAEEHYVAALLRLAHVQMSAGSAMAASDLEFRARRILGVAQRSSIALTMFTFSAGLTLMLIAEPLGVDPPEPIVVVRNAGVPHPNPKSKSPCTVTSPSIVTLSIRRRTNDPSGRSSSFRSDVARGDPLGAVPASRRAPRPHRATRTPHAAADPQQPRSGNDRAGICPTARRRKRGRRTDRLPRRRTGRLGDQRRALSVRTAGLCGACEDRRRDPARSARRGHLVAEARLPRRTSART
jgi:hypothetical protein